MRSHDHAHSTRVFVSDDEQDDMQRVDKHGLLFDEEVLPFQVLHCIQMQLNVQHYLVMQAHVGVGVQ